MLKKADVEILAGQSLRLHYLPGNSRIFDLYLL